MKVIISFLGDKVTDTVCGTVRNVDSVSFNALYDNELSMTGENIDVENCIKDRVRKVGDVCVAYNIELFKTLK